MLPNINFIVLLNTFVECSNEYDLSISGLSTRNHGNGVAAAEASLLDCPDDCLRRNALAEFALMDDKYSDRLNGLEADYADTSSSVPPFPPFLPPLPPSYPPLPPSYPPLPPSYPPLPPLPPSYHPPFPPFLPPSPPSPPTLPH